MAKWVNDEIDQLNTIRDRFLSDVEFARKIDDDHVEMQAIADADKGNIEPLRRLHPRFARFLFRPKQKRGKRFPKYGGDDRVGKAADDVPVIRALWKRNYGKKNRPKNDPVTAEQIAADRWQVDVEAVVNRLKKTSAK